MLLCASQKFTCSRSRESTSQKQSPVNSTACCKQVVVWRFSNTNIVTCFRSRRQQWISWAQPANIPRYPHSTSLNIDRSAQYLVTIAFANLVREDTTIHVRSMGRFFFILACIPYLLVSACGLQKHFMNTMVAAERWSFQNNLKCVVVSGENLWKIVLNWTTAKARC